ncbi:DUF106 domain-containing protein [Candidatus Pacearchaeota archaeon]|nr:DUF106 domain-containing protein [Candidatus Pacearchaeota archaeon]
MITGAMITEMLSVQPKYSIAMFSVLVTLVSTMVQKWLTNQEHLKTLKARQKELQKEIKKTKDPTLLQGINKEMMDITMVMFKSSMKPMFVTIIPFLLLFSRLKGVYVPVLGSSWIWYYLGYSIVASMIIRKVFKVA